jgi:hypothetical protein
VAQTRISRKRQETRAYARHYLGVETLPPEVDALMVEMAASEHFGQPYFPEMLARLIQRYRKVPFVL